MSKFWIFFNCSLFFFSCHFGSEKFSEYNLPIINMPGSSICERIELRSISDVSYVKLDTDSSYLVIGNPSCVTDSFFIFKNYKNKNIMCFDCTGKKRFLINRRGSAPEEYMGIGRLAYDEKEEELFCEAVGTGRINVYKPDGTFVRSLDLVAGYLAEMYNYNDSLLLCHARDEEEKSSFLYLLHKTIPHRIYGLDSMSGDRYRSLSITKQNGSFMKGGTAPLRTIIHRNDRWIYSEPSHDTIYELSETLRLRPFLAYSPQIRKKEIPCLIRYNQETENDILISLIEMIYDVDKDKGFPEKDYIYDREAGKMKWVSIINEDFPSDPDFNISSSVYYYSADNLREALEKGELGGRLRELALELDEEDNGILLLMRFKE